MCGGLNCGFADLGEAWGSECRPSGQPCPSLRVCELVSVPPTRARLGPPLAPAPAGVQGREGGCWRGESPRLGSLAGRTQTPALHQQYLQPPVGPGQDRAWERRPASSGRDEKGPHFCQRGGFGCRNPRPMCERSLDIVSGHQEGQRLL